MNIGVTFKDDDPLGTGGEFRIRRARVFNAKKHVGNIYAVKPEGKTNRHTQPVGFFYAPLGKYNQPAFHGDTFDTLTGCKRSLIEGP